MPRPNQLRSIASEKALARRVAHERESRGMSYEGLASRMTKAGCPIQASAIYKIEKADPPRRITVDELVAFAQVFGVPVEQLLLPPEAAVSKELGAFLLRWHTAQQAALAARDEAEEAWDALKAYIERHREGIEEQRLAAMLKAWSESHFEDDHEFRSALHLWRLTKSPHAREQIQAEMRKIEAEEGGE